MTSTELYKFLQSSLGPQTAIDLPDENYAHPTREWLFNDFAKLVRSFLIQTGQLTYVPESNDCDDFSRFAASLAQLCNNQTPGRVANTALAFGEFWYQKDAGGGHAINAAVIYENGQPVLVFFEPQNQLEVTLTKTEIESCDYSRF